ncbi:MAG: ribbon-helix-helix domain-containing protein [Candidatus Methanomethylicia archaeon]
MKVITIRLPEAVVREIDLLINSGRFSSRAEVIREAVRDFVRKEFVTARSQLKVVV